MQKVIEATLAIPILAMVYLHALVRRAGQRQILLAVAAFGVTAVLIATAVKPAPATGTPPSRPATVGPALTTRIETGESPTAAITITFPAPMNTASVAELLHVEPWTATDTVWDDALTQLTITPQVAWAAETLHTVTVDAGALEASGRPVDHRLRAAFLTRRAFEVQLTATATVAGVATPASHFRVAFSGPVDVATIHLDITPSVDGHLGPAADSTPSATVLEFVPLNPLPAGQTFTFYLGPGALDADGGPIEPVSATVGTAAAPSVVRFRPGDGTTGIGWSDNLSVRFTEPMDHASTEAAWSVKQDGKPLAGKYSWAENDTVLVFNPGNVLGYSQKIVVKVGPDAASVIGLPLTAPASATFTTLPKPVVKSSSTSGGSVGVSTSGGSIGGSSWAGVEAYYLKLMNCTRTGGVVTSTGACSSPGGRSVAPLRLDAGITTRVSRPYARKLAVGNICTHYSGGTPGTRLAAAGYTNYTWAQNLGCRDGDPYAAVLASHLFFQSEWSYSGGHYVNLMNPAYDRVGIGVWVSNGRVRLVVDFYSPR